MDVIRIGPWLYCELLAVRGVRMRNARLTATICIVQDGYDDALTASLVGVEHVAANNDDEDDGA